MTPEGEFRDAAPPRAAGPLDRALARIGAAGMLVALITGGLVLAGLAVLAISVLLPIALVAAARPAAGRRSAVGRPLPHHPPLTAGAGSAPAEARLLR